MILKRIKFIFEWINKLDTNIKTFIILVLLGVLFYSNFLRDIELLLDDQIEKVQTNKLMAEQYTKIKTPEINANIESILKADSDATHVILMNYHNTVESTLGLSYRYLTAITEKRRSIDLKVCFRIFKELEYVYYGEEVEEINRRKYLRINNLETIKYTFPNLVDLLKLTECKAAAVYPIRGYNEYIGNIVILYSKPKDYQLGYYEKVISEPIQKLAILLDYNLNKDQFKKEYESR